MTEFEILQDGEEFIVCADGQRLLSCKSHVIALRAAADATLLLEQEINQKQRWRTHSWA